MNRELFLVILIFCITATIYNCKELKEQDMKSGVVYEYVDGSGNSYTIEGGATYTLEYEPVKPGESSSGFYDGGDYLKRELGREEYEQLAALFRRAFEDKDSQIKNRVMLSGLFIIKEDSEERRCIHAPDSVLKAELEELVKRLVE